MSPRSNWNEPDTWDERFRVAVEQAARRREARRAERQEFARRRAHGLIDRNAARLAEVRRRARVSRDTG
ncbi:hypothetical protein M1L60_19070 [Actinoplanes sp. TRM 88003]|uniref:Uncharacterized protein n=1 Tax=Paractinoplanes aksuensis TaxID=2939490 RepID=A0ABT1DPD7_9ACTN|nr:hypothetical protein [Actinoplanes aksuensis]MCO8272699.1 hypothetical protein [Actinoplanes aksuensis]